MSIEKTSIFFCTWNCNAEHPDKCSKEFRSIFDFEKKDAPDLVVIGFQELVDLDFKNTALTAQKQEKAKKAWREFILDELIAVTKQGYVFRKDKNMVGVLLMIFIK